MSSCRFIGVVVGVLLLGGAMEDLCVRTSGGLVVAEFEADKQFSEV